MPRRKWPTLHTVAVGPSPKAKDEVWNGIHQVLRFANQYQPITADSPELARLLDSTLTALSLGRAFQLRAPDQVLIPIANLGNIILPRAGYYLRRCPWCKLWFLAKDRRRTLCYKPACTKAAHQARMRALRRIEKARHRASRRG